MRVLFVGQSGADAGGAERSLQLLISNLPARIVPTVLLFQDGAYADELRRRGFSVEVIELGKELLAVKREKLSLAAAFGALAILPRLVSAFRRLSPDVIYTNTVKAHVLGALAGRIAGFRVVSHYRDILNGRGNALLRTVAFMCTRQRVSISKAVAAAINLPNTAVVPNPLELSQYAKLPTTEEARTVLGLPQHVPLVAIVGRINRWKGHDRFLRIAKIVADHSNAHFVIVGKAMFRDADFTAELATLAADLGIANRVHNVPWLSDPRVAYAAINVNCNTSRAEPFGRTIIEAAACGVPTVAFDEGGAPEAIDQSLSGRVVLRDDDRAFAQAILTYLIEDRDVIAANARKHARLFDAALHGERIAAILDRVVVRKRGDVVAGGASTPGPAFY